MEFSEVSGEDVLFEENWAIVRDWSESSRYENNNNPLRAELMVGAIGNPQNGILQWLKRYW